MNTSVSTAEFTRRFEGWGYCFTLDALQDIASLLEAQVGPGTSGDRAKRFHIRGNEYDFACQLAAEIRLGNVPRTITHVDYMVASGKGWVNLALRPSFGNNGSHSAVEFQVTGMERDWVVGACDRIAQRLDECRVPWRWLYGRLAPLVIGPSLWFVYTLLGTLVLLRFLPKGKHLETLLVMPACLMPGIVVLTLDAIRRVWPNTEIAPRADSSREAYRIGTWAVLLGVLGAAIWQLVLFLLDH